MIVSVISIVVLEPLFKVQLTFFPPTEKPLSDEVEHTSPETVGVALGGEVGGIGVSVGAWVGVGDEGLVGVDVAVEVLLAVGEGPGVGVFVFVGVLLAVGEGPGVGDLIGVGDGPGVAV